MTNLQNNPLNREILSAPLGGHPDYGQMLHDMGEGLPEKCYVSRSPYAESFCCSLLARSGVVFGAHVSMSLWLRLPEGDRPEESDEGRNKRQLYGLGPEWVEISGIRGDRYRLLHSAYDYALELLKTSPHGKVVVSCPSCSQKLRAPSNLGTLTLTCPKCKHCWSWSPE